MYDLVAQTLLNDARGEIDFVIGLLSGAENPPAESIATAKKMLRTARNLIGTAQRRYTHPEPRPIRRADVEHQARLATAGHAGTRGEHYAVVDESALAFAIVELTLTNAKKGRRV